MLWRRASLLVLWLGVSGEVAGQTPEATGVDRLIRQALEQNREILAAQQRVAELRGVLKQAGVGPAPTVEVTAASGRPLGTAGEEELTAAYVHPVELGGKRSKRVRVAEIGLQLAEAELAERRRQLAFEIKTRYIEAVAGQRRLAAIDRIVSLNRESFRLVDARVQRDDAAPLERQLLLVEMNRTEAQRASTAGQANAARFELQRSTGASGNGSPALLPSPVPATEVDFSMAELRQRAVEERPDLLMARTLASQSSAELELAEALGRPDVSVSAQYARRHAQFEDPLRTTASGSPLALQDRDNIVTVGISIPLQSRKRNEGNIETAVARQRAAGLRREQLEITIPLEVAAAWERYQAARGAVAILNRGVLGESERNLSVIRQAYNLGQLRMLDVLNEQRRMLETELSYIDAEAELSRSRAELERAVGGELK